VKIVNKSYRLVSREENGRACLHAAGENEREREREREREEKGKRQLEGCNFVGR